MNGMSFSEKIDFIKSLRCGDYICAVYNDGFTYLSIVKDVEKDNNVLSINELASVCVDTPEENDDEVDFLYYNTNFSLYGNPYIKYQVDCVRKATQEEIEYMDRLLKEDGNKYSNGKMIKL